jgi:hypothetical protein
MTHRSRVFRAAPGALALILVPLWCRGASGRDLLEPQTIHPGLLYARYQKQGVIAHVLKLDLREKSVRIRSIKAKGKETIRQLVARLNEETLVVGGINGDFFRQESAAGIPYGVQVCDGRLTFAPLRRSMIGFGPTNEPYIGVVSLKARIGFGPKAKRGAVAKWAEVNGVNVLPEEISRWNGIYLYTPAFLGLSSSRPNGLIAVVEAIQPALQVGDVCEGTVARIENGDRSVEVPEAGCLIYFFGDTALALAAQVRAGDPVTLKIELPPIAGGVAQAIGGGPRLIREGKKVVELKNESFDSLHALEISSRHPRSAIGYDQKKQNLFLVMVEGRHEASRGMTFGELAILLADLGCYQAMAFDGGGSAGMYVAGKGMVSLSMGGPEMPEERPIANGLLITAAKAPAGKEPAPARPAGKAGAKEAGPGAGGQP